MKVQALVYVGDAMEEAIDDLCAAAGQLGLLGVPAFMFQEGYDPIAEQAFREMARLSRGAYCRFDPGAAHELAELLRAAAAYAAGGVKALPTSPRGRGGSAEAARTVAIAMPAIIIGILVLVLALWALHSLCQGRHPKTRAHRQAGGRRSRRSGRRHSLRRAASSCWRFPSGSRAEPARLAAVRAGGLRRPHAKSSGQVSRVRSAFIEMELDHDTGNMRGDHPGGPLRRQEPRCARCRHTHEPARRDRRGEPRATGGLS